MPFSDVLQPNATPPASSNNNGLMTAEDKTKLDGIDVATTQTAGLVKPDNETIKINDGVITSSVSWVTLE